ncbi:AMIN domain-containing protein [Oceanidesulfovibrio marinus]|uniref:AMIN domain-containing protein n=1 Tax=Oceanidesulfovibrio marinus TaxID=370038 RepID=A0A6P1ZC36_9BACT|nr:AMIN domain-containing protein [Oceanidesulfovibrio marinus]TVM31248.1 hypothetical protein DQK91_19250 [Oceanidesulfovibrio marinus]
MNPKITYVLLGIIFVVMALIIVSQVVTREPAMEPEIVAPATETAPPANQEQAAPEQGATERQPMQAKQEEPQAPEQEAAAPSMQTPPGEQPAAVPFREQPAPLVAGQNGSDAGNMTGRMPVKTPAPEATAPEQAPAAAETATTPAPVEQTKQTAKAGTNGSLAEAAKEMSQPAPGYKPIQAKDLKHENTLRLVSATAKDGGVVITFKADRPIGRYKYFTLTEPSRLVVDLIGEWEQKSPGVKVPQNELLSRVRFGRHDNKLRIVADLSTTEYAEPVVKQEPDTQLVITLTKK